jgi:hypothetical protein
MQRLLPLVLLVLVGGCFDFSKLTECNGSTAWLCDNFERGTPDDAWTMFMPDVLTGAVDSSKAHAGSKSFHVTGAPSSGGEFQLQWKELPQTASLTAFVRAYVFLPVTGGNTLALFTMVEEGSMPNGVRVLVEPTAGLQLHDGIAGPDAESSQPMPIGRWTCLEWQVVEANAGMMTLWIDDTMVATVNDDTLPTTKLGQIGFGVVFQGTIASADPFELWFDDVILDDQRIGCGQ